MLSAALYTRVKQGGGHLLQRMSLDSLMEELNFLSQLLRNEFVYGMFCCLTYLELPFMILQAPMELKVTSKEL